MFILITFYVFCSCPDDELDGIQKVETNSYMEMQRDPCNEIDDVSIIFIKCTGITTAYL